MRCERGRSWESCFVVKSPGRFYPYRQSHAMVPLTPDILTLIEDAAHMSYWRKVKLRDFLRRVGVPLALLAAIPKDLKKTELLGEVISKLEETESGRKVLQKMARKLAAQTSFPDLMGWESTKQMLDDAKQAVAALKKALDEAERNVEAENPGDAGP
jgi:hypothetical protein